MPWPNRPVDLLNTALNTAWSRAVTHAVAGAGWLGRARCGLIGHVMIRHFEPHRMSLECLHCGERTPGWTMEGGRA
jgi:hypothetical protein